MVRDMALLGARLAVGAAMAAHGARKAFGWFDGAGPDKEARLMHELGFRPGPTYAFVVTWSEIVSGGLVAIGFGGPLGPALMWTTMLVAHGTREPKNGFFAEHDGFELAFIYGAAALSRLRPAISARSPWTRSWARANRCATPSC